MQQLASTRLENKQLLLVNFTQNWDQDDIPQLAKLVFEQLATAKPLDHVQGADREYYRFQFAGSYLILHFECYSNACWVEEEDQIETDAITRIHQALG